MKTASVMFLVICTLLWLGISAEFIQRDVTFQSNSLTLKDSLGYIYLSLTSCSDIKLTDAIGKPIVPIKTISILVPSDAENTEISYQAIKSETIHIENIPFPTQPPKLTLETEDIFIVPDSSVYSSGELYPENNGKMANISEKNGWKVVKSDVYPIQYIMADSLLIFIESISYSVSYLRDGSITETCQGSCVKMD
ncbi:MAG: hypothetical protein AB7T10_00270 [bacterium]